MSDLVLTADSGADYEPCPVGVHWAQIVKVEKGEQTFQGETKPVLKVRYQVTVGEESYLIFENLGLTLNKTGAGKPSKLRERVQFIIGRELEEGEQIDLSTMLGEMVKVMVNHASGKGANADKTYANIVSIAALDKGETKPEPPPLDEEPPPVEGDDIPF
jgi:hypothetical protein